jgi:hypothetical protein
MGGTRIEDDPMPIKARTLAVIFHLGIAGIMGVAGAHAQTITNSPTIALKSGESAELGQIYWVVNCRSVLKSTPEAEILDGPPGVSVAIKAADVTPRTQRCSKPVPGGTLVITAGNIEDASYTTLTVRITYRGRDGDRKPSVIYNLSLLP